MNKMAAANNTVLMAGTAQSECGVAETDKKK